MSNSPSSSVTDLGTGVIVNIDNTGEGLPVLSVEAGTLSARSLSDGANITQAVVNESIQTSSSGGGVSEFTQLTDCPGTIPPYQTSRGNPDGTALTFTQAIPVPFSVGLQGADANLTASQLGNGYICFVTCANSNSAFNINLPDAVDLLAYTGWLTSSQNFLENGEGGFLLRIRNNNVATGSATLVEGEDVTFFQATAEILPGTTRDYMVFAVNNSPDPTSFYLTDAGQLDN